MNLSHRTLSTRGGSHGFTLIEIIVAIAIVAILAAIALPSYRSYVIRTNRALAKSVLSEIANKQDGYAVDHKVYTNDLTRLGYAASPGYIDSTGALSSTATNALYKIEVNGPGTATSTCTTGTFAGTSFLIVATPQTAKQNDTTCGTLCVSSTGEHGNSAGTLKDCWGH